MALNFWQQTNGTWLNILTVLAGTTVGLLLKQRLPEGLLRILTQGIGLVTLWLGGSMANRLLDVDAGVIPGPLLGLVALTLGGALGEGCQVESRLNATGDWLKQRVRNQGQFTEGFVAASVLFCIGPMTLVGSLENGLSGNNTLLAMKATMDGIVAVVLASSYGMGVGCSAGTILLYQGGISLVAGALANAIPDPTNDPRILLMTGVGGLTILGIGLNLLEITRLRVASFLPALALVPPIYWLSSKVEAILL